MAIKAEPKQRYLYVYEWQEVLSQREDVRQPARFIQTRAYSDDQAYLQLTRRYPLLLRDQLRLLARRPVPPRRKKTRLPQPTPSLF